MLDCCKIKKKEWILTVLKRENFVGATGKVCDMSPTTAKSSLSFLPLKFYVHFIFATTISQDMQSRCSVSMFLDHNRCVML